MQKKVDFIVISFYTAIIVYLLVQIILTMSSMRIRIFDEAIYANNALEMLMSGNWLCYTVDFEPDLYNTKPPLVLWLQVISLRIFGPSPLGVRIPSFIALLFLGYGIWNFSKKRLNITVGLLAIIIVLSTPGLIVPHVFLTGDLDAVLVMFSFFAFTLAYKISLNARIEPRDIYLLGVVIFFGFLTKSTAVFLLVPSLLIIFLYYKKFTPLLTNLHTYITVSLVVVVIALYYITKEFYQPGAWHQVWFSEVERLYNDVMPWHHHGFFFYFERIYYALNPYYLFVTLGLAVFYFLIKNVRYKKICSSLLLATIAFLLFVSLPDTKLDWYLAPILPVWSVAIAIMLYELSIPLARRVKMVKYQAIISLVLCVLVLAYPVYYIQGYITSSAAYVNNEEKEMAFINALAPHQVPTTINILSGYDLQGTAVKTQPHNNDVILFYKKSMGIKGKKINLVYKATDLQIGDTVVYGQEGQRQKLYSVFDLHPIDANHLGSMVALKEKRPLNKIDKK